MNRQNTNPLTLVLIVLTALLISTVISCGGNDDVTATPNETNDIGDTGITIKIGNITDLTGPGSNGMELVNFALEDIVRYYNENNVIPGVEFEVVNWDGQIQKSILTRQFSLQFLQNFMIPN